MFDIFGAELPTAAKFFIAFAVVIGLIALTAWLVRRFGAARLGGSATRGRQPRLAVIDAAAVDGRRRLVLIRRDNIEHLLMIGGPSDVVVEQNIVRSTARGERHTSEPAQRSLPLENGMTTSLQPASDPVSLSPSRPRASFGDDNWTASETPREPMRDTPQVREPSRETMRETPREAPRLRPDSLTGMAADLSAKLNSPDIAASFGRNPGPAETFGRAPSLPPVEPPRRVETEVPADKPDHNLAEMASRLEAALRRPPEGRPPVTDPLAVAPVSPPRPRPQPPLELRASDAKTPEPRAPELRAPAPDSFAPASLDLRPTREPPKDSKASTKAIYDSLEQEMASLLGRPANKQ